MAQRHIGQRFAKFLLQKCEKFLRLNKNKFDATFFVDLLICLIIEKKHKENTRKKQHNKRHKTPDITDFSDSYKIEENNIFFHLFQF